jgi:hypothetical protein
VSLTKHRASGTTIHGLGMRTRTVPIILFELLLLTGVEASLRSDSGGVGNLALDMKTEYADAAIRHVNIMLELGIVLLPAYHASRPLGDIDEALFRHSAMQAIPQLRANRTIHIHVEFPAFGRDISSYTMALLHDLRCVADNTHLIVHVFLHAKKHLRSELLDWLGAVGGRIVFHEDDRCVRDVDREWVGQLLHAMSYSSKKVSMGDWRSLFGDKEWLPSLLATFADAGGCMIESMESKDSMNIYVSKTAANEVVNILNCSGILWDNLITDKVRDLTTHQMAVIPYRIPLETGKIMDSSYTKGDWTYLYEQHFPHAISRMGSNDKPHKYFVDLFLIHLCKAIIRAGSEDGNMVWIFQITGDPFTSNTRQDTCERIRQTLIKLPPQYDSLMSIIYNTLDQFKQDKGKNKSHSERKFNCKEKQKDCLRDWKALKDYWTEQCVGVEKNDSVTIAHSVVYSSAKGESVR